MGIHHLHKQVCEAVQSKHLSEFRGWTAGVDISSWIYKAIGGKVPVISFIEDRIKLLRHYEISIICVFDGPHTSAKNETIASRRSKRGQNANPAPQDRNDPNSSQSRIIEMLVRLGVDYIVAPHEADPQLAYLSNHGFVQLIISEDSDMIVLGCAKVLFKLKSDGIGDYYDMELLSECFRDDEYEFEFIRFRIMCIFFGCDYVTNIPEIGTVRARRLFKNVTNFEIADIVSKIPEYLNKEYDVPKDYITKAIQADLVFQHQVIFDPILKTRRHLNALPSDGFEEELITHMSFLGDLMEDNQEEALQLATGNIPLKILEKIEDSMWKPNYVKPEQKGLSDESYHPYVKLPWVPPKCTVCGRNFSAKSLLKIHMRVHTGEKPFSCMSCERKFSTNLGLTQHVICNHTYEENKPYPCNECERRFNSSEILQTHKINVHKVVTSFPCEKCQRMYPTEYRLKLHLLAVHSEIPMFPCLLCEKKFRAKKNLHVHMKYHDKQKYKKHVCTVCKVGFIQKFELEGHMKRKHRADIESYPCPKCQQIFKTVKGRAMHLKKHSDTNVPRICPLCEKTYHSLENLNKHIKKIHQTDRPFCCKKCKKGFKTSEALKRHLSVHNIGEHACKKCGKRFGFASGLRNHEKSHGSARSYACSFCELKFKRKSYCTAHEKDIHGPSQNIPCPRCDQTFRYRGLLRFHLQANHGDSSSDEEEAMEDSQTESENEKQSEQESEEETEKESDEESEDNS